MDRELQEKITGAEEYRAKTDKDFGVEEFEPFYDSIPRGKLKADKRAIDNLASLPRPLSPPRKPAMVEDDVQEPTVCK